MNKALHVNSISDIELVTMINGNPSLKVKTIFRIGNTPTFISNQIMINLGKIKNICIGRYSDTNRDALLFHYDNKEITKLFFNTRKEAELVLNMIYPPKPVKPKEDIVDPDTMEDYNPP